MSLKSAVSYCRIDDSLAAGTAAIKEVINKMEGDKPDFLLLFATVGHDLEKLTCLRPSQYLVESVA